MHHSASRTYYPYGLPTSDNGIDEINRYLYGEKEFDLRQGLNVYDFLARTYAPDEARFWQPDPNSGDYTWLSPYTYCGGDPVNRVDKNGKDYNVIVDNNSITIEAVYFALKADADLLNAALDFWNSLSEKFVIDGFIIKFDLKAQIIEEDQPNLSRDAQLSDIRENDTSGFLNTLQSTKSGREGTSGGANENRIIIYRNNANNQTSSHEMGHTLGLKHSMRGLMTPSQDDPNRSMTIGAAEIQTIIKTAITNQKVDPSSGNGRVTYKNNLYKLFQWNFRVEKRR